MSYQRKHRGKTQSLFLIESIEPTDNKSRSYAIMGSTGNVYTVTIKESPTCTCPDYVGRFNRCKHIYFVLIRIMNANEDQDTYDENDLSIMFHNALNITNNVQADTKIKNAYDKLKQNIGTDNKQVAKKSLDDLCPICLDDLENGEELDYCKFSCGKSLHTNCFKMWIKAKKPICVFCKENWFEKDSNDKYINIMAAVKK